MPQKGIFAQAANWQAEMVALASRGKKALRTDHIELCCHFKPRIFTRI
jgi:hypothetical protein